MADEVSDVFSIMARSGELLVQVLRPLTDYRGRRETRMDKEIKKEQLQEIRSGRARALMQKMAHGQIQADRLLEAYGPEQVEYARLSGSQLPEFQQAAGALRLPYAIIRLPADQDGRRDVLIAYCRDHAPSMEALLEMTKAEILSEKEGNALAASGIPEAVEDFEKLFARSEYKPEELTFLTCFIEPEDMVRASEAFNQRRIPHLVSDELGIIREDPLQNGCLTFFGGDMERAAAALREAGVRLRQPEPEILRTEVIAREAHSHKIHRARFEAQEAARIHFSELTDIPLPQAEKFIMEMRREGIAVIADYGVETADILIADDDLDRARQLAERTGVTKEFRSVESSDLKKGWEQVRGEDVQLLRERAQAGRRRAKEKTRKKERSAQPRSSFRGGEQR